MGLTSAMYTGLSGLNANQFRIDTIGDNIANVNTTAFKSSRSMFQTQFSETLAAGTAPGTGSGGTNPMQVGLGSVLGSVQRDFNPGSIETTGVPTDCAIEGNGFFVTQTAEGRQNFTRDGTFKLSSSDYLVTQDGSYVQGYGIDSNFNIVPGAPTRLSIPLGSLSTARATSSVQMKGNLMAGGDAGTQGTILLSQVFEDGPGAPATAATLLTNLYDTNVSAVNPLFVVGDEITLTNVKKGDANIAPATMTVTAATTLGDYLNFLTGKTGIDTSGTPVNNPGWWMADGTAPDPANPTPGQAARSAGPPITPPAGTIVIEGNVGTLNSLQMNTGSITSTNPNNASPFTFGIPIDPVTGKALDATGSSVHATVPVYDSLGTSLFVDVVAVLESQSTSGNTWRFYASSKDDTDLSRVLGNGTLTFGTDAVLKSVTGNQLRIPRDNTGAVSPLGVTLDFSSVSGFANLGPVSTLYTGQQDGYAAGSLNSFSIGNDGKITGSFSNGQTRTLGQLVVATFTNPEGLVAETKNNYAVGPNSGVAVITTPQTLGAGKILSGSLELSNVDLSKEFIGLITASTGFSAASRVISTSNDLLNQLLQVAR